ncbi:MAG: CDP-2,3-bis-(O-geranylgeranyl)-sn-glycerol synthase [Candidatus Heimdallarchaeota archaeon]|nr:CDP-2,3-bis-(O-geranylgeranyl)-sn-glycerol synthase [Candidatus Heimdallarchaeota archaeon]
MVSGFITDLVHGFIFLCPAFFANSAAAFTSGLGAIDRGKLFRDGKPLLGKNKTIGGVLGGTITGGILGMAVVLFFPDFFKEVEVRNDLESFEWYYGFILGFSALIGDAIGSFAKRRMNLKPGAPFPVVDQVGFVVSSFLIVAFFMSYPIIWVILVIPAAFFLHLTANIFSYKMNWQKVWW